MTEKKKELTEENKAFCMLPWVHLYVAPNGECKPCCLIQSSHEKKGDEWVVSSNDKGVCGNTRNNSIQEIRNGQNIKDLRLTMLQGEINPACNKCYELEEIGLHSMRMSANKDFGQHYEETIPHTQADGFVPEEYLKMRYVDIRFSNICNFRCRSCGPQLSSRWHQDTKKLFPSYTKPAILRPTSDKKELWDQIESILDEVEEIYFAGGEPLIMDEHYQILKILEDKKAFHVRLRYNTNFSEMKYKGLDVMKIWAKFDRVDVGASLDASWARGEYMRKEQDWNQVVENRKRMMEVCPNTNFFISCTVSIFNIWHLPDFYLEWCKEGFIDSDSLWSFHINPLVSPTKMQARTLTEEMKEKVDAKYRRLLTGEDGKLRGKFASVLDFMWAEDCTHKIPLFIKDTEKLDEIRGESVWETFPELLPLQRYNLDPKND